MNWLAKRWISWGLTLLSWPLAMFDNALYDWSEDDE